MKYVIYRYRDELSNLIHKYPCVIDVFRSIKPDNVYHERQLQQIFADNENINNLIYQNLSLRKGYKRSGNKHYFINELTNEKICCIVSHYYITILSKDKYNIFFDILYQISQSYVIMSKQV